MATKRSRPPKRVSLAVAGLGPQPDESLDEIRAPAMPWLVAALAGGALSALAGWLVVVAPIGLAWLTTPVGELPGALRLGTQVWLLGHGAGATLDRLHVTLVPLGLTALFAVMLLTVAGWAARQAQLVFPDDDLADEVRRRTVLRVALAVTASYGASVGLTSFLTSTPQQTARALLGAVLVAGGAGVVGAARTVRWQPTASWPRWARLVPRSAAAALLTLVAGSSLALVAALWRARARVVELTDALGADLTGQLALVAGQVAYVPNLVLWCGSWVLGAGFTLGDGSVVSPTLTQVGLLPGVPVAGAVPPEASGQTGNLWWLCVGVLAGAAAAYVAGRDRRVRFDEQAIVGTLAGGFAGLVFTLVALLSRGDLGVGRLVGLGPRPVELAVMSVTLLGLSGMAAGLVLGLVRRPLDGDGPDQGESTEPLQRRRSTLDLTKPIPRASERADEDR